MPGFYVHRSNASEALVAVLAEVVRTPLSSPWIPEVVVVQGPGVERWLTHELAERFGVFAHCDFPFPRTNVERILSLCDGRSGVDPYEPTALTLTLIQLLREFPEPQVVRYIGDDIERRVDLARRLAELFDRYLVYRPEWIAFGSPQWNESWQSRLWSEVEARLGDGHFASRWRFALSRLEKDPPSTLPERLCVFGPTTLPPSYLTLYQALGAHIPVHLFALTPSAEYWGDIQRQLGLFSAPAASQGPRLLHGLGWRAREFQAHMADLGHLDGVEAYADPGSTSLLKSLQSDMLHFRLRPSAPRIRSDDRSVQIHTCHSPMREVEVVHDILVDCFARDPDLAPHQVAVMVPSIEEYAPLFEAVFGTRRRLPYRISDRRWGTHDTELQAIEAWLDCVAGRVSSAEVIDLLDHEAVRRRFGLGLEDIELIRDWVVASGIRWGIDPDHRRLHRQPADDISTWSFGLARLWMGFAVDGQEHPVVGSVAPLDAVRSTSASVLAAVDQLVEALASDVATCGEVRTVVEWATFVLGLIERFCAPASQLWSLATEHLQSVANVSDGEEHLPWSAARGLLLEPLRRRAGAGGFAASEISVCELIPMRSIPFDTVVVVGLSDGAFPRPTLRESLDLTSSSPRRGDSDSVADDRNTFLEAFMSARSTFVATYVGRSIKDNESLPPSPVVSELLAAIAELGGEIAEEVVRHHPLHPFSSVYFGHDERLFTYEERYASIRTADVEGGAALLRAPAPVRLPDVLELSELIRLLKDAPRFFLERVVGASADTSLAIVPQRETLEPIGGLQRWQELSALLHALERQHEPSQLTDALRRSGALPIGSLGEVASVRLVDEAAALFALADQARGDNPPDWVDLDLDLGATRLIGRLDRIHGRRRVLVSPSRAPSGFDLAAWIPHLAGLAAGVLDETVSFGTDRARDPECRRYGWVDDPHLILADMVDVYALGTSIPLPLFRGASPAFVRMLSRGRSDAEARRAAAKTFLQHDRRPGGELDQRFALMFPDDSVMTSGEARFGYEQAEFGRLAARVYGPIAESERRCES